MFCKQHPNHVDPDSQAALSSVITAPAPLRAAIDELVRFKLIKEEGRELLAHRVVQEAMNYHSIEELQESFDSASALIYEAFPKQKHGDYLKLEQWGACRLYAPHATQLSLRFATHRQTGAINTLKGLSFCQVPIFKTTDLLTLI